MVLNKFTKVIILLLLLFVILQLYLRLNYGAITIYVQNQNNTNEYHTEILIDNNPIAKYSFNSEDIIPHKLKIKNGFGSRELSVLLSDTKSNIQYKFNNYLVKWIVITLEENEEITIQEYYLPPKLQ